MRTEAAFDGREGFEKAAARRKLRDVDPRVFALDGDVKDSTRASKFAEGYGDRFVEGYIAEQALVGMALGLQALGAVPFFSTFAAFLTRAYDFIQHGGRLAPT